MADSVSAGFPYLVRWSFALLGCRNLYRLIGLCVFSLLWASGVAAKGLQPVPELTARVMDFASTLTEKEEHSLGQKLAKLERQRGSQLVVLVVPTTAPETIEQYANRVASDWKLGRKDVGDGILLLLARNDRAVRIEVARALEGTVTDLQASHVIQRDMIPHFKEGRYAQGLDLGVDALIRLLNGSDLQLPKPYATQELDFGIWNLFQWAFWGWLWTFIVYVWLTKGQLLRKWDRFFHTAGNAFLLATTGTLVAFLVDYFASLLFKHSIFASYIMLGTYAAYLNLMIWSMCRHDGIIDRLMNPGKYAQATSTSDSNGLSGGSSTRGGSSSRSRSGGFSSGGGGSFGGGGASGRW